MGFLAFLRDTVGVDPGTQNLRVVRNGELIFNERSQISLDRDRGIASGFGDSISTNSDDVLITPVNYVIADFQAFEMLLRSSFKKKPAARSRFIKSYIVYFSLPSNATEIEKRAYRDSAEHAGAVEVHMVFQCVCAAAGMGILFEKKNFILIDFSASKVEMTVFGNGLVISDGVVRLGTWKIFRLLKNYVHRRYKVELSDEEIKGMLDLFSNNDAEVKIHHTTVGRNEVQALLDNFFCLVNDEFLETIERVSRHPDIAKVIGNGVYFTGGGSTIDLLRRQIRVNDKIKTTLSQNPFLDNINGLKEVIANRKKFMNYLMV